MEGPPIQPFDQQTNKASPADQLTDNLAKLTTVVDALAKRVEASGKPGLVRRWTRRSVLAALCAGAGALWVALQPSKDPEFLDDLPPNARRYRQKCSTWLNECIVRSGNRFAVTNIDDAGSVYISLQHGLLQQQGLNSLTIETDQHGRLLHLAETHFGGTHLALEIFPEHKDIRRQTTFLGTQGGTLAEYEWYTINDALSGRKSSDGRMRQMQVDAGGHVHTMDPESPSETLAERLATPHRMALFQKIFGTYEGASNFLELVTSGEIPRDFRIPFAEFHRRKFKGNCNDFAEMACEILSRHRYPMHLLTVRPRLQHEILHPWHTVAAIPEENGGVTIIDSGDLFHMDTIQEYAGRYSRQSGREMIVAPDPIGYVEWEKVDTAIARWLQHAGVRR